MGKGDRLASGDKSAPFSTGNITQEKWDAIWDEETDGSPLPKPQQENKDVRPPAESK